MNAAFLLVTTAWLAGDAPAAPAHGHAAVAPAACGTSCCDTGCCDSWGHRMRGKLRGLFSRDCCQPSCCQPAPVCCQPAPVCRPAPVCCQPAPTCCDQGCHRGCGIKFNLFRRSGCDSCAPATCGDACCCDRPSLFDKLRGLFQRDCCESACCATNGCGAHVAPGAVAPRTGEPIPPPKKMPAGRTSTIPSGEVRITTPATGRPIPASAPALEPAPAIVPMLDADNRNPF